MLKLVSRACELLVVVCVRLRDETTRRTGLNRSSHYCHTGGSVNRDVTLVFPRALSAALSDCRIRLCSLTRGRLLGLFQHY